MLGWEPSSFSYYGWPKPEENREKAREIIADAKRERRQKRRELIREIMEQTKERMRRLGY
jgi:F0F1-type ATP synthase membrane subunit b/b'